MKQNQIKGYINKNTFIKNKQKYISIKKIDNLISNNSLIEDDIDYIYKVLEENNILIDEPKKEILDYDFNGKDFDDTEDIFRIYLKEMSRYPMLSEEDEHNAAVLAKQGDKEAKDLLIKSNLRLVISNAKKMAKQYKLHSFNLLDLVQEGNLGLMKAVDKFDATKGYKFSTYATWWIRQAISRSIKDKDKMVRNPVHFADKIYKVNKFIATYFQKHNKMPSVEVIQKDTGLSKKDVLIIMQDQSNYVSLDSKVSSEDQDAELGDFIADLSSLDFNELENDSIIKEIKNVINKIFLTDNKYDQNGKLISYGTSLFNEQEKNVIKQFGIMLTMLDFENFKMSKKIDKLHNENDFIIKLKSNLINIRGNINRELRKINNQKDKMNNMLHGKKPKIYTRENKENINILSELEKLNKRNLLLIEKRKYIDNINLNSIINPDKNFGDINDVIKKTIADNKKSYEEYKESFSSITGEAEKNKNEILDNSNIYDLNDKLNDISKNCEARIILKEKIDKYLQIIRSTLSSCDLKEYEINNAIKNISKIIDLNNVNNIKNKSDICKLEQDFVNKIVMLLQSKHKIPQQYLLKIVTYYNKSVIETANSNINLDFDNDYIENYNLYKDAFKINREKEILEKRLGLFDGNIYTLELLKDEFHITKERVRQLQNHALKRLKIKLKEAKISVDSLYDDQTQSVRVNKIM